MILLSVPYLIAAVLDLSAHIIYLCNLLFSLAQSQHLTIHHWNGITKLVLFSLRLFHTKWACGTFTFTLAMLFMCYGLHYFFSLFCCYKTTIVLVTFKLICSVFIQPEIKHAAHVPACHNIQECVFFSEKEMPSSCRYLNTCNVNFGSRGQGSKVHKKKNSTAVSFAEQFNIPKTDMWYVTGIAVFEKTCSPATCFFFLLILV